MAVGAGVRTAWARTTTYTWMPPGATARKTLTPTAALRAGTRYPMPDSYSVEYEITDGLAAKYARAVVADRWFFQRFARGFGPPLYLLFALLFAPVLPTLALRLPAGQLLAVVAGLCLGFWALLCLLMYRHARDALLLQFHGLPERTVRVTFAPAGITLAAAGLTTDKKWEDIDAIQVYRTVWLFRLRPFGYFVVPDALVSPELEALIRARATELAIRVRG